MPALRVAIVEDEPSELESLRRALGEDGFECVAAYSTAETALKRLPEIRPQAVIVDLALPRMSGAHCIWKLRRELPEAEFLVHTVESHPERVFEALQAGASGYLVKGVSADGIRAALREVMNGGSPMTASIARLVVRRFRSIPPPVADGTSLSRRQEQVLALLMRGLSNKEVADRLGIGAETVRTHIRAIYQTLQVHSRGELFARFHETQGPSSGLGMGT